MKALLSDHERAKLEKFARTLVNQKAARIIVPAQSKASGFWFGGGNMIEDAEGNLYLVGRFPNQGDSRTGLHLGERGLELAFFRSRDRGQTFEKFLSFSKSDLNVVDREVLSIEGSCLRWTEKGVELFVSTEKQNIGYPPGWEPYLKPGAGVWTIDYLQADSMEALKQAPIRTLLESSDPRFLHVKDPLIYDSPAGESVLLFCTHPYCWSSSNTALAIRGKGESDFQAPDFDFFPRGFTWDIAMTRATCVIDIPAWGSFTDRRVSLVFYDGGESLRNLDEHSAAVTRPRGYSCEEIGGVAYVVDGKWREITRLSSNEPWFISPYGTGCSRYVDVHASSDGYYATWQQSQNDRSQPLVMNMVPNEQLQEILS